MVRQLNFPVEIHVAHTIRDPDGLAMSSRNKYLNPDERTIALKLPRGLFAAKRLAESKKSLDGCLNAARQELKGLKVDYLEAVDANTLDVNITSNEVLLLIAAWVGKTRLIDNVLINLE
jgi:pantoate--beta-alanine ligase